MPVLVEDAAEAVASVDVEAADGGQLGDRRGQCAQRPFWGIGLDLSAELLAPCLLGRAGTGR